eukprot:11409158-Ditylum_brightwellii.AAC.1
MELEDPTKSQKWRTVDLPEEILHYLTIWSQCHSSQAKGTLFTMPPLSQHFDWAANLPVSNMVMKGEFNSEELDNMQKLFIQHCKLETGDNVIGKKSLKTNGKTK